VQHGTPYCFVLVAILLTISPHGRALAAAPPRIAEHFTLPALGHPGRSASLSQYAGRPVLVNFFSSTCAPCRQEAPLLARFYRSHHGQVAVVGIDVADVASSPLRFTRQAGISYPIGSDPAATAAGAYGVIATPQTVFLNADHRIANRIFGPLIPGELSTGLTRMR
jgi:cytochrome c biogenesis protein CcmG/thiol:disulfide interchange protein DsbE